MSVTFDLLCIKKKKKLALDFISTRSKQSKFAHLLLIISTLNVSHSECKNQKANKRPIHELASNFSHLNAYNAILVHFIEAVGQ